MKPEEKSKPKMIVATPYADRTSKEYEVVESNKRCTRCGRVTTWVETETGAIRLWCLNCSQYS